MNLSSRARCSKFSMKCIIKASMELFNMRFVSLRLKKSHRMNI